MGDLRKVQQTPTGTFFVCLPRAWANQNGLKKGTLVNLDVTSDGKLIVDSEYTVEQAPRVASLTISPFLSREIIGRYLLGYDVIRIEAKDRITYDVRNVVKSTVTSLIGLEIVEETVCNDSPAVFVGAFWLLTGENFATKLRHCCKHDSRCRQLFCQ